MATFKMGQQVAAVDGSVKGALVALDGETATIRVKGGETVTRPVSEIKGSKGRPAKISA